jgi:type I restriction enzyme M protein
MANSNERVVQSLWDCFQGSGSHADDCLQLTLQLLAWAKLSRLEAIPDDLSLMETSLVTTVEDLKEIFQALSQFEPLGENRAAFQSNSLHRLGALDTQRLLTAIEIVQEFSKSGQLEQFEIPESCYFGSNVDFGLFVPPVEVGDLILGVAGPLDRKRVYCPYDIAAILSRRSAQAGAEVYLESLVSSPPLPWLTNIFSNTDIQVRHTDPVIKPGYLQPGGQLEKFDITLAYPPIGLKYNPDVVQQDWFNRFPERTNSGDVLQLRHILSQTQERVVLLIANRILFRGSVEQHLRAELLQGGVVEAVIGLPSAILPFTAIPMSIMVLDLRGGRQSVRFVDGSQEQFSERDPKSRSRLVNWQELLEVFHQGTDESVVVNVPVEEILRTEAYLEVSRYMLSPERKQASAYLQDVKVVELGEVVEMIRPVLKPESEGELEAYEVTVADFPDFGYLKTPKRQITLEQSRFTAKESKSFLQPGDLIIATKGSVGKVAIVPETVPPAGEGGWVVNQSCMVLRPDRRYITPQVLWMYLRSDIGQTLLQGMVSGATVPMIQLRSLQKLQVVIPSREESEQIQHTFQTQVKLQQQIDELRREQERLRNSHWGIEV